MVNHDSGVGVELLTKHLNVYSPNGPVLNDEMI